MLFVATATLFSQAFVDKGYHPKTTALGHSAIAMKEDAALLFYNPASIGFENSAQVFAGFTQLYPYVADDNLNVLNAGAAYAIGSLGTAGIGFTQFAPNFWSERSIVFSFASTTLLDNLSLGLSAKLLSWSAESPQGEYAVPEPALSYTGMSFDIGALFVLPEIFEKNDLQFAIALNDVTQPVISNSGNGTALPLQITAGFAFLSHRYDYTLYGSSTMKNGDTKISIGYELSALKTTTFGIESEFIVRIGMGRIINNDTQGDYNGGFGLSFDQLTVDYSYSYQAAVRHIGGISSIALSYDF
ncbi:MAG: hypothetical protein AB1728_14315 [Bacteroidota bacterium]